MSTAHRPTWKPAVGRSDGGGWNAGGASSARKSTLDLAAHTKLKLRHGPQVIDRHSALRDSILKLEEAEKKAPKLGRRPLDPVTEEEGRIKLLKQTAEVDEERYDNCLT
jgi:protein CWC15